MAAISVFGIALLVLQTGVGSVAARVFVGPGLAVSAVCGAFVVVTGIVVALEYGLLAAFVFNLLVVFASTIASRRVDRSAVRG